MASSWTPASTKRPTWLTSSVASACLPSQADAVEYFPEDFKDLGQEQGPSGQQVPVFTAPGCFFLVPPFFLFRCFPSVSLRVYNSL